MASAWDEAGPATPLPYRQQPALPSVGLTDKLRSLAGLASDMATRLQGFLGTGGAGAGAGGGGTLPTATAATAKAPVVLSRADPPLKAGGVVQKLQPQHYSQGWGVAPKPGIYSQQQALQPEATTRPACSASVTLARAVGEEGGWEAGKSRLRSAQPVALQWPTASAPGAASLPPAHAAGAGAGVGATSISPSQWGGGSGAAAAAGAGVGALVVDGAETSFVSRARMHVEKVRILPNMA